MALRIGFGYDIHKKKEGRTLMLGGVTFEGERGLDGHSDADVLLHAIGDALLGALALGDLGRFFPDSDPQWKNADEVRARTSTSRPIFRAMARARVAGW